MKALYTKNDCIAEIFTVLDEGVYAVEYDGDEELLPVFQDNIADALIALAIAIGVEVDVMPHLRKYKTQGAQYLYSDHPDAPDYEHNVDATCDIVIPH